MITDCEVLIDAPAGVVWDAFADVERWPDWTASVTRIVALDGAGLGVGKRFSIKQPKLPTLVWQVTELSPGTSWTWEQRSPGGLTVAHHDVAALSSVRTRVGQRLEQTGPVGSPVALLMRSTTRRYLDLEAAGLKRRSERLHQLHGPKP